MRHAAWVVPLALLAVALVLRVNRWLTAVAAPAVHEPPARVSPVEAGVIVDGRFGVPGLVTSMVNVAVRGLITLQRMANGDILLSIARAWQQDKGLRPADLKLLVAAYAHGDSRRPLSELRGSVKELDELYDSHADRLAEQGILGGSPSVLRRVGRWGSVIVAGVWIQICWAFKTSPSSYGAGLVTGVLLWLAAGWLSRNYLTPAGQRARRQLLGLRKFMNGPRERHDRLPGDAFYTLLPWAIALGVSDAWIKAFAARKAAPAEWYAISESTPATVAQLKGELTRAAELLRPR